MAVGATAVAILVVAIAVLTIGEEGESTPPTEASVARELRAYIAERDLESKIGPRGPVTHTNCVRTTDGFYKGSDIFRCEAFHSDGVVSDWCVIDSGDEVRTQIDIPELCNPRHR